MKPPLDFWNYPMWSPDGRDNLRDPGVIPFWMRPAKIEDEELIETFSAPPPYAKGLIIRHRNGTVIPVTATPGGGFYISPEDEKLLMKEE